eukprot:1833286-Pyramimonas_sp.AAC.1
MSDPARGASQILKRLDASIKTHNRCGYSYLYQERPVNSGMQEDTQTHAWRKSYVGIPCNEVFEFDSERSGLSMWRSRV